ncbi:hypothetical protein LWI29_007076 [Acer saccharum]|uniref:Chalcone/stilbene synthase N-terminal domain-containing protein n=1 Tax=Acer saccharum TaxID=4024 RepID=A0AA39W1Z3_ACESA|nr:hypothetical protein LWI29_007076 [Acer saccharum]
MLVVEIPKSGKEAAMKAIKEWGQSKSKITHLIFITSAGCFADGTALCHAKDLTENNKGAHVLVVCSEMMTILFHGPSEDLAGLVGQALFGDGAAAMIVGSDPIPGVEKPYNPPSQGHSASICKSH